MNAQKVSKLGIGLTLTALALCAAMAVTTSCAGGGDSTGGSSGGGQGGGGGGQGGSTPGNCPDDPGSSGVINFCNGKAQGTMTGYGWVALGELDTISNPTCKTDSDPTAPITKAAPCNTQTNWNAEDALCIDASIPALPASPVQADYDANWGVQIGVNTSEPPAASGGTPLGGSWTSVTITMSGSPTTGLRAELHRNGDGDNATFCANMTSGTKIALTSFSTQCWSGCPSGSQAPSGLQDVSVCYPLTADDVAKIDKVGVQVSSTASAITVSNLCLKEIKFE
jgi:hypothetical protein